MKKLILSVLLLVVGTFCHGQISIDKRYSNVFKTVTGFAGDALEPLESRKTGPTSTCTGVTFFRIYKDSLTVGMILGTENPFDDDVEISLGRDAESALKSFTQIKDWFDSAQGGTSIEFTDIEDRVIQVLKKTFATGRSNIFFKVLKEKETKVIADDIYLTEDDMRRALSAFQSKYLEFAIYQTLIELNMMEHPSVIRYKLRLNELVKLEVAIDSLDAELSKAKKNKNKERIKALKAQLQTTTAKKDQLEKEIKP